VYGKKTNTRLSNKGGESYKKSESGIYSFVITDETLYFNNNGKKFVFKIDSIKDNKIILNAGKWTITIVQNGAVLIWTWENNSDSVFHWNTVNTYKKEEYE